MFLATVEKERTNTNKYHSSLSIMEQLQSDFDALLLYIVSIGALIS